MLKHPLQAPYQVKNASGDRASVGCDQQMLSKTVEQGLKGKILSLGVGGDFKVVNKRVLDSGKEPRGDGLVCGMVEIRAQGVYVVEFKDRYIREIETCQ